MADGVKLEKRTTAPHIAEAENSPSLSMVFTRNRTWINQYKQLREDLYKSDPRFVGFRIFDDREAENYEDPNDQMLILHDGKRCYGGACLRISTPEHPVILDLERDIMAPPGKTHFPLKQHIRKDMDLDHYAYTEFNRIVIDPSLRRGEITRQMFRMVLDRCIEYRVRYMFGIGDVVRTRLYMQIYAGFDLPGYRHKEVDIPTRPEYEDMKMHLISGDMKKFHVTPEDPEATLLRQPGGDFSFS